MTTYDEQISTANLVSLADAKKVFSDITSEQRVMEAVDSILLQESVEDELSKFEAMVWDTENYISMPETYSIDANTVAEWNEDAKTYVQISIPSPPPEEKSSEEPEIVEEIPAETSATETEKSDDSDLHKNLSWLLDFKVESVLQPLEKGCDCGNCENIKKQTFASSKSSGGSCGKQKKGLSSQCCNSVVAPRSTHGKPPFTYTELIEEALKEKGELTVSGIYKWISQKFPYYQPNDDRWKNSVRHNLSINPHFSKGGKARKGAGHLWTVVTGEECSRSSWKRRRLEQIMNNQRTRKNSGEDEANKAARLISTYDPDMDTDDHIDIGGLVDENNIVWRPTAASVVSMEQTAEDILRGVRREVAVEYMVAIPKDDMDRSCGSADSDFLNPVPKYEVVKESGLLSDENLVSGNYCELNHGTTDDSCFFSDDEINLQYIELTLPNPVTH